MREESESGVETFKCNVEICRGAIIPHYHDRIHCLVCTNYDLCIECHRNGLSSGAHNHSHQHQLIQAGGGGFPMALGGNEIQRRGQPNPFWDFMITDRRTPSAHFGGLIETLFDLIDKNFPPNNTRRLEPEKCKVVMTMLEYADNENPFWYLPALGQQSGMGISWSDAQIAYIYQQHSWEFEAATRSFEQQRLSIPERFRQRYVPAHDGMPLLTRNGFRDMLVAEALADPTGFCHRFNALVHEAWKIQPLIDPATRKNFPNDEIPLVAWPAQPDSDAVRMRDEVRRRSRESVQASLGN